MGAVPALTSWRRILNFLQFIVFCFHPSGPPPSGPPLAVRAQAPPQMPPSTAPSQLPPPMQPTLPAPLLPQQAPPAPPAAPAAPAPPAPASAGPLQSLASPKAPPRSRSSHALPPDAAKSDAGPAAQVGDDVFFFHNNSQSSLYSETLFSAVSSPYWIFDAKL